MTSQKLVLCLVAVLCYPAAETVFPPANSRGIPIPARTVNTSAAGVCPSQAHRAQTRAEITEQSLQLLSAYMNHGLAESNPAISCSVLPASSLPGYYWIQPTVGSPAVQSYCDFTQDNPISSCSDLPNSPPSGYYWMLPATGPPAVQIFCDFNRQCGCDGPSTWTRLAYLDMSNSSHYCPTNWATYVSPVRSCGRGSRGSGGCAVAVYSSLGQTYSRVCGRIIGYQESVPSAFVAFAFSNSDSGIESTTKFLEGVTVAHGNFGSLQHVWSFVGAIGEVGDYQSSWLCSCSNGDSWPHSTAYVGNDYFCDSGNHDTTITGRFFSADPLWDGAGCGPESTCCEFNNPPWFCRTLPLNTTDDLQVRICNSGGARDTPIRLVELYVQ